MKALKNILVLLIILLTVFISSFSNDDDFLNRFPNDGYNLVITIKPQALLNSFAFTDLETVMGKHYAHQILNRIQEISHSDLSEIESITMAGKFGLEALRDPDSVNYLYFFKCNIKQTALLDHLKKDELKENIATSKLKGHNIISWHKYDQNKALALLKDGYFAGNREAVENAIKNLSGNKTSLTNSTGFLSGGSVFQASHVLSLKMWDFKKLLSSSQMKQQLSLLDNMGTCASLHFENGLKLMVETVHENEESALAQANMFKKNPGSSLTANFVLRFVPDPDLKKTILDDIVFRAEGNVTIMEYSMQRNSPAYRKLLAIFHSASHYAKQSDSAVMVRILGQNIEEYIMNNNRVGSPKIRSIEELVKILNNQEGFLNDQKLSTTDAWGNKLVYIPEVDFGSRAYIIKSLGSDGKEGPATAVTGVASNPEEDLIWENGRWVQPPAR